MTGKWEATTTASRVIRERVMHTCEWVTAESEGSGGNQVTYTVRENEKGGVDILCNGVHAAAIRPAERGGTYFVKTGRWTHLPSYDGGSFEGCLARVVDWMRRGRLTSEWADHFSAERAKRTPIERFFASGRGIA